MSNKRLHGWIRLQRQPKPSELRKLPTRWLAHTSYVLTLSHAQPYLPKRMAFHHQALTLPLQYRRLDLQ
jgi:hypothetical protein